MVVGVGISAVCILNIKFLMLDKVEGLEQVVSQTTITTEEKNVSIQVC
jgi:hypothetical protein